MSLVDEQCTPPQPGQAPLSERDSLDLAREVPEWRLEEQSLVRDFSFRNFMEAIYFVNQASIIAQAQDHHPDILISYNKVRLTLSTHKIGGLSRNDFIMAARIDRMLQAGQGSEKGRKQQ